VILLIEYYDTRFAHAAKESTNSIIIESWEVALEYFKRHQKTGSAIFRQRTRTISESNALDLERITN
ncbi:14996_t:CDS:2, partial [Gigaspora margarita]